MRRTFAFAFAVASLIAPARAAELCIACEEPAATYRCSVERPSEKFDLGGTLEQQICSKVMEKKGAHAKCHVAILAEGGTCDGPARTVTVSEYQQATAGNGESTYEPGAFEVARRNVHSTWLCLTSGFKDC
jgi:hypothetical protein